MTDASFDPAAERYDDQFSKTIVGKMQRSRIWRFLEKELSPSKMDILEINCGTGIDAKWLSGKGHDVIATDVSSKMISVAQNKFPSVKFEVCGFSEIATRFKPNSFDLVFSNFAGLNCVDESALIVIQKDISEVLKPKGKFIGVFLGRESWMEQLYFRVKGKKDLIYRRRIKSIANIDDVSTQPVWCYLSKELRVIFNCFSVNYIRSVGFFVLPSYLEPMMRKSKVLMHTLFGLEIIFGGRRIAADRSDHIYISFSKN